MNQNSVTPSSQEGATLTIGKVFSPKKLKILFAEDMVFFRKQVTKVLQRAGHTVVFAVDGKDALNQLENTERDSFDLVLSDIEMPNLTGIQLAKSIRLNSKWKNVPLIALTTRCDKASIDSGLKAGFDIYLEKMNPEELLNAVNQLIHSKSEEIAA